MTSRFDGLAVDVYEGKFSGSFELPEQAGEELTYDTTAVFVVTGVSSKANFAALRNGDIRRTTTFDLLEVDVLTGEQARDVLALVQDGEISLPAKPIDEVNYEWFNEAAAAKEAEADADIAAGRVKSFDSPEEFLAELDEPEPEPAPEVFSPGQGGPEVVGQIRQSGDPALARFLGEL